MKTSVLPREDMCSESVLRRQVDVGTALSSLLPRYAYLAPFRVKGMYIFVSCNLQDKLLHCAR